MEAIGLQGMLKAARSWRPDGGMSFTSFAITCIQRTMQNERTYEERRRKRETNGTMPLYLSEPVTQSGASIEDFLSDARADTEGAVIGKEALSLRFRRVWNRVEESCASVRRLNYSTCRIERSRKSLRR